MYDKIFYRYKDKDSNEKFLKEVDSLLNKDGVLFYIIDNCFEVFENVLWLKEKYKLYDNILFLFDSDKEVSGKIFRSGYINCFIFLKGELIYFNELKDLRRKSKFVSKKYFNRRLASGEIVKKVKSNVSEVGSNYIRRTNVWKYRNNDLKSFLKDLMKSFLKEGESYLNYNVEELNGFN